jgi:abortive infection bacteriophage resistance protein
MSEGIFKSIDEQIDILEKRGLTIRDKDFARDFLLKNNYYRISGYSLTLRNHDVFYSGTSFENIVDIYNFDRIIRNILAKYLEIIEVSIKSIYAYKFSEKYGGDGYLSSNNFTDVNEYLNLIAKINEQKNKRIAHEAFIKHFVEELKKPMPMWVIVDLLTFSDISILYNISEESLKVSIAKLYGLNMNNGVNILKEYLHELTILRNFCAHGSRLFNRLFVRKPSLNSKEKKLLRKLNDGSLDNSHLFGFVLVMKRLLKGEDFLNLKNDLIALRNKIPFVSMNYYGFCDNWEKNYKLSKRTPTDRPDALTVTE